MALLRVSEMRARARRETFYKATESVILEHVQAQAKVNVHDIFMSHAFDDKELVLGATKTIEDMGYTVYLDWRDDPTLDRKNINAVTAARLRARMQTSKSLFFATTENSSTSKWMPWELGFKDGDNGKSAILPIIEGNETTFSGQEYLSIYPYVSDGKPDGSSANRLWIHRSALIYVRFDLWLEGIEPHKH